MSLRKPFLYSFTITLGLLSATSVLAWTGPSASPPGTNASAPVNISGTAQIKSGNITAGGLSAPTICIGVDCRAAWPSSGSGTIGGSGTTNYVPKFTNSTTLGNSLVSDNGTGVNVAGSLTVTNAISDSAGPRIDAGGGWIRTYSNSGWYNQTFGGGWFMSDATWLRSYGGKAVYMDTGFDTNAPSAVSCGGGLGGGYTFRVCGSESVTEGLRVGNAGGAYTYITLLDDESTNGVKYIHANSNVIGFLGGNGSWLAYFDSAGTMHNAGGAQFASNGDVYMPWAGQWLSTMLSNRNSFGGGFQLTNFGGCYIGNSITGGCSCPGYAPNARFAYYMDTNSTFGGGRGYVCSAA